MPQCRYCQQLNTLCTFCVNRLFERHSGAQARALRRVAWVLCRGADPTLLEKADHELGIAVARIAVEARRRAPSSPVAGEAAIWCAYYAAVRRYEQRVSLVPSAVEFLARLNGAIMQRRYYRRFLRSHHVDIRRGVWRSLPVPASVHKEAILLHTFSHQWYQGILQNGLLAVLQAQRAWQDPQSTLRAGALAMRHTFLQGLAWQIGYCRHIPIPQVQDWATLALSGWVRPQIRVYPCHRQALREFGEAPRTVLLEWLPEWVCEAFHNGVQTPTELLETVRRYLDKVRPKAPRRTRSTPQSQGQNPKRPRRPQQPLALETWAVQEATLLDVSALQASTKLSPKESLVLGLRNQGWKLREIAAQRGVDVGTIKKEERSAQRLNCSYTE